jgi:hypothetical protein
MVDFAAWIVVSSDLHFLIDLYVTGTSKVA